jgi:hypothetical protein
MSGDKKIFERQINTNHYHDSATVRALRGYGDLIELELSGRDPTTVIVRLSETVDARDIGRALIEAADALDAVQS